MDGTHTFRSFHGGPFALAMVATAVIGLESTAASPSDVIEKVPVHGGFTALARALDIEPPDAGLCVSQLARVVYGDAKLTRPDSALQRLLAHFKAVAQTASSQNARPHGNADLVPVPLPAAVWSDAVFHRSVPSDTLFAAVLSDQAAALVAHGLSALDDETLLFFANHPAVLTRLYQDHAGVFSAFAAHFHIRHGRVVPPGGDPAVPLWEALLNEKVSRPDGFINELFARDKGRLAYLYDIIGHLDTARAAFALGLWIDDAGVRLDRFRALSLAATSAYRQWDVRKRPFTRPAHDLLSMLSRVEVAPNGMPRFPAARGVWAGAFDEAGWPDDPAHARRDLDDARPVDAAWLAEAIGSEVEASRAERIDQLTFGQRRFSEAEAGAGADALVALRAFRRFRMLMLTLDHIGVGPPHTYAAMARHAHRLSALGGVRGRVAIAQFQGAIALIARLARVKTIDRAQTEALLTTLAAVPLDRTRGYEGALALWVRRQLGPALSVPDGDDFDAALLVALAGPRSVNPPRPVFWEGQQYRFDLVTSEVLRLRRVRGQREDASIDVALRLHRVAHKPNSTALPPVLEKVDGLLGEALVALSYAADWSDARGMSGVAAAVASRHDFGFERTNQLARVRTAWALPRRVFPRGRPWHVEGAILGLDIALAPLALRRITDSLPPGVPALSSNERDTFVTSLG
ncbi:MAG: hypothetical protein ACRD1H_09885, partial [Vicinamibacterales bacterium]